MAIDEQQMALAEQIADIYLGSPEQAPRVPYPSDWDRAFIKATNTGLEYAIQILTDKAETDCDHVDRYQSMIQHVKERIEYNVIHGMPFGGLVSDSAIIFELNDFQIWLQERDPEIQEICRQAEGSQVRRPQLLRSDEMEPNALVIAIDNLTKKLEHVPVEKKNLLNRKLDVTFREHFAFQNTQAAAHAGGKISLDVANTLYTALGGTHTVFNAQPLAVKVVVTQFMALLMEPR